MNIIAETIRETQNTISNDFSGLPRITSFLVKVTARCNLNCDYCYVFNHADQSWKKMPSVLSSENREILAERIAEYAKAEDLEQCLILFHGGEPLLVGVERIIEMTRLIKEAVGSNTKLYFSMQTNGTLLTEDILKLLESEDIGVSLSLDGPKVANDIHRLTPKGNSSFEKVMEGYNLLKKFPKTFTGVIGVIDPHVSPRELLDFFAEIDPPQLDFLLPDSNYITPPPFRDKNENIYVDWLITAFNIWFDDYPHLNIRLFEGLLATVSGLPSSTDAFGLGDISLLTIETDGYYHDLDVLKITEEGFSSLDKTLSEASIHEALMSPKIANHRKLLSMDGLSDKCKACPEVSVCGGGSVPHRYDGQSFNNPTVYCREMLSLISHIRRRLIETVALDSQDKISTPQSGYEDFNILSYEQAKANNAELDNIVASYKSNCKERFIHAIDVAIGLEPELVSLKEKLENLPQEDIDNLAIRPSTVLWASVLDRHSRSIKAYDIEGKAIKPDPQYLEYILSSPACPGLNIHSNDYWLRCPFGSSILFESDSIVEEAKDVIDEALKIIKSYNPHLLKEIEKISSNIQFVSDPSAHPDKIVSFSDNAVPGALYVSIRKKHGLIDPYDLADSIIHEHRHQKLYILEQFVPVVASDTPLISSPWREEKRPVSGVFHGAFVFHELKKYWQHVAYNSNDKKLCEKARAQAHFSMKSLGEALASMSNSAITPAGKNILEEFMLQNNQTMEKEAC